MTEFNRKHRPIPQYHLDAAARGLKMATASDAHLHEIVRIHKDLDIFPSIVITEAAYREMRNRRAANHLAISHDEHAGMSTSHPSAPSKTSLDRPEETQERLRALPAVRRPGLPN